MVEGIFHQRLQGQFGDLFPAQLGWNLNLVVQNILITHLLDLQIALDLAGFLLQSNDIRALTQGIAEKV